MRVGYGNKAGEHATTTGLMTQEFEHAQRLENLHKRQRKIESELDLDKDEAGTQSMTTESI